MGLVRVVVLHPTQSKKVTADIPDDAASERIVAKLVTMLNLPSVGPDGNPVNYKLHHRESERLLDGNETLAQANVQQGHALRLVPEFTAG